MGFIQGRGGELPYMSYIGMCTCTCGPKGYGFKAILVIKRVWFLLSSLKLDVFLEGATFSSLAIRPSTKALHNAQFNIGLN